MPRIIFLRLAGQLHRPRERQNGSVSATRDTTSVCELLKGCRFLQHLILCLFENLFRAVCKPCQFGPAPLVIPQNL